MRRSFLGWGMLLVGSLWMMSAPTPAFADTFKCQFTCRPSGTAGTAVTGPGQIGDITVPCTGETAEQHAYCGEQCNGRCQRPGPEGNGLTSAAGSELVCTDRAAARCIRVAPAGSSAPAPAPSSGGGGSTAAGSVVLPNPVGTTSITDIFGRLVQAFLGILGSIALFWFVWGSILWMTAADSKRHEDAKSIMKNAALGVLIIFFSYGLTTAFLSIFEQVATESSTPSRRVTTPPPTP
jgi:hypothetical protein